MEEKNNLKELFTTHKQCKDVFGVHHATATGRGVKTIKNGGVKTFLVSEILSNCNDLIINHISDECSDLKKQKFLYDDAVSSDKTHLQAQVKYIQSESLQGEPF